MEFRLRIGTEQFTNGMLPPTNLFVIGCSDPMVFSGLALFYFWLEMTKYQGWHSCICQAWLRLWHAHFQGNRLPCVCHNALFSRCYLFWCTLGAFPLQADCRRYTVDVLLIRGFGCIQPSQLFYLRWMVASGYVAHRPSHLDVPFRSIVQYMCLVPVDGRSY